MTIGKAEKPIIGRCEDVGFGELGTREVKRVEVPKAERHERAGALHQVFCVGIRQHRRRFEPGRDASRAPRHGVLVVLNVMGAAMNEREVLRYRGEKLEDGICFQPDS